MESIGHFILIAFTFPLLFSLSIIWIGGKFLIFLLISLYGVFFKGGFNSTEDLILFPIRLINATFQNSNMILDKFSEIYYETSSILIILICFIMLIFYGSIGNSSK